MFSLYDMCTAIHERNTYKYIYEQELSITFAMRIKAQIFVSKFNIVKAHMNMRWRGSAAS
jgi:hypothetical protein